MNKFLAKIAGVALGLAMAIGVGVSVSSEDARGVRAASQTVDTIAMAKATSGTIVTGKLTYASYQGGGTSSPGIYGGGTRLYQGSNTNAGGMMVFTASNNAKINKVTITNGSSYDTTAGYAATAYTTSTAVSKFTGSSSVSKSGTYSTGENLNTTSVTIACLGTSKSARLDIVAATIIYDDGAAASYNFTKTGTNCTVSGPNSGSVDADASFTVTPDTYYNAPTFVTVQRGETTLSQGTGVYSYSVSNNVGTLIINKSQITAAITVSATATPILPSNMTISSSTSTLTASGDNYVVNLSTGDKTGSTANVYDDTLVASINSEALDKKVTWSYTDTSSLIDTSLWLDDEDHTLMFSFSTATEGSFVITATSKSGSVVRTVTYNIAQKYSITTTVTNGTYSGDTVIYKNGSASVTIAPTGDYKLPTTVSVSGATYEYNSTTGVISLSNPTGDVTISAAMVALTEYSITVNETNGTYTGDAIIKEGKSASLTFTPASGYGQPSDVSVSGAKYTWTRSTGILSLYDPSGNVTVTYVAVGNELDSITISVNEGNYVLGDEFVKPTVTAHYTVASDKDVTDSEDLVITGYDPYKTGDQAVTFTYTEGGIEKTTSYTAHVAVESIVTTTTWTKVTDASTLAVNDEVAIVASGYSYALSQTQNSNNRGRFAVTKTSNNITWTNSNTDGVQELTLKAGTVDDTFGLYTGSGYLYAASSGSNYLRTQTTNDANGSFAITITNGVASIVASGTNTNNKLKYNNNNSIFSCYGSGQQDVSIYKKYSVTTGDEKLIRITASYEGGDKYVGDSISVSDFTVKKQLNTSENLVDVTSGFTLSTSTLASTSNTITVSYTEGGITKTADVVIAATERPATVTSVTLVQGQDVVKDYIDWSGTAWDYTGLTVHCVWSVETFNEDLSLADLVAAGTASVEPAKPAVGVTSFEVSYTYHGTAMTSNTVSDISVVADYITNISWTGTTASHFKAFSGGQLTTDQVGAWSVIPTWKGAGEGSALSFNDYTLKVGTKTISELPYTWQTEDDGKELSITYGKDIDGNDFVKKNSTAVGNICASINTISHDESSIEERTISNMITNAVYTTGKTGTSGTGSDTEFTDANGLVKFNSDKGYKSSDTQLRVYAGGTYVVTSEYNIKTITFTVSSGYEGGLTDGSEIIVNAKSWNSSNTTTKQARITGIEVVIDYEGTDTVVYSNKADHFETQKAVVEFATYLNEQMNATNACNGTFEELSTQWALVATKYNALFGTGTALDATELEYAKKMLKYTDAKWGGEAEADCVERAMKTYDICVSVHGLTPFMFETGSDTPLRSINTVNGIGGLNILNDSSSMIIVIISLVSITSIGGFFFLRKRKDY